MIWPHDDVIQIYIPVLPWRASDVCVFKKINCPVSVAPLLQVESGRWQLTLPGSSLHRRLESPAVEGTDHFTIPSTGTEGLVPDILEDYDMKTKLRVGIQVISFSWTHKERPVASIWQHSFWEIFTSLLNRECLWTVNERDGATIPAFEVIRFLVFREAKAVGTHARHGHVMKSQKCSGKGCWVERACFKEMVS